MFFLQTVKMCCKKMLFKNQSSNVLHSDNSILHQEKWINAEIINSSNDLVVVLEESDVVSSKNLENCQKEDDFNQDGDPTGNPIDPQNINVVSHFALADQRKGNFSTVEDGVLFVGEDTIGLGPTGDDRNNDFLLNNQYQCDAYTDTEIEINAKCYARQDNDMSFSKSRGKKGSKPRNIILQSSRATRSHTSK